MAITTQQAVSLCEQQPFLDRVHFNEHICCLTISNEAATVPLHTARMARVNFSMNDPFNQNWHKALACGLLAYFPLANINMVGTTDCDLADLKIQGAILAIWNLYI